MAAKDYSGEGEYFVNRSEVVWAIGTAILKMLCDCPIIGGHNMLDARDAKHRILREIYQLPIYEMEIREYEAD